ncbi:hypothetical protein PspLS_01724 [Pyricularia sp. CBS 133598]|nr:hypothetical protein PspLS_01724 [Pyricularia sp. CBS 133598]
MPKNTVVENQNRIPQRLSSPVALPMDVANIPADDAAIPENITAMAEEDVVPEEDVNTPNSEAVVGNPVMDEDAFMEDYNHGPQQPFGSVLDATISANINMVD